MPCRECPFRRDSASGYLGAASGDPRGFLAPYWFGYGRLPCHMRVDWEAEDAQEQAHFAPLCAGFLILAKNAAKLPFNPDVVAALRQTERNTDLIFTFPHEFYQHHEGGPDHGRG